MNFKKGSEYYNSWKIHDLERCYKMCIQTLTKVYFVYFLVHLITVIIIFFSFLGWGETESTSYGGLLTYYTSPGLYMMNVEQWVEWELAGETEVLGENLPRFHSAHHKSHMTWPGLEPGPPRWAAGE
jgi:hypothetical protein